MKTPSESHYRTYQKNNDLEFELLGDEEAPEVYNQDLVHHFPVEDEHDMENVSFDIHADIIKHSQDFLNLYNDAKLHTEDRRRNEKQATQDLINEIDAMIKLIGDSAIAGKMYYGPAKDLDIVAKDFKKDQEDRDRDQQAGKTPKSGTSEDEDLKNMLHKEVLDREEELRALIIRDDAQTKDEKLKREIMQEMNIENPNIEEAKDEEDENKTLSLQDKIRQRIEKDGNFERLDKDKMLFDHDKKLEGIEDELDKERSRQEHALAQLLKSRADAKRKRIALGDSDGKLKEQELDKVQKDFDEKMKEQNEDIDKEIAEHEIQLARCTNKDDKEAEEEELRQLKQRKRDAAEELEKQRIQAAKDAIEKLEKQRDMDENEIKALLNKFIPPEKLEEINQDFEQQKENINQQKEFELEDLKRRQDEEMYSLEDKLETSKMDDNAIDVFINTLSQRVIDQNEDADEEDKEKHLDRMNNLRNVLKDIDTNLEKEALMNEWDSRNAGIEGALRKDRDAMDEKVKDRLAARKADKKKKMLEALKIAHEEEEAKLVLDQLSREHQRKGEINRDQICRIVKLLMEEMEKAKENGEEIPELTLNKIKQLFESMFGEVEMTDFTNQLVKHFAEKEIMLKRLLARYADLKRMEKASIKRHYADKMKDLEEKQDELGEDEYERIRRDLAFKEGNSLRELDLNLDKLHKEEEAALMQSLEKKNAKEAIQLKNDLLEEKIKAYNTLFKNQNRKAQDEEIRIYKKALWNFKAKKEKELERRLRAIEFAKQKVLHEIEREIQNKIKDYEELLRRRSEEEKWINDRREQMRQALLRHKELIKERMGTLGDADKERIFSELDKNYKGLSTAIERERKRMFLEMQKQDQKRKEAYKDRNVKDFYENLGLQKFGDKFRNNERFMLIKKMEETAKREYMYLKQPGALISELLKRVKNLEKLLRTFDSTRIYPLMQSLGDKSLQARLKK